MSDAFDDEIAEMFPDAEKRAKRRAKLHERLDTFFDAFLENDGSWVDLDRETTHAFYDIFREIVDLKIARDCDGDSQMEIEVSDRRKGSQTTIVVPRKDYREITEEVDEDYIRTINYAIRSAANASTSAANELESYFRQIRMLRETRLAAAKLIEDTMAIVTNADYDSAAAAMIAFHKNKGGEIENPAYQPLFEMMGKRFATEKQLRVEDAIKRMAPFNDDNQDDWSLVRTFLADSQRMFGPTFGADSPEYKEKRKAIYAAGLAARKARRIAAAKLA